MKQMMMFADVAPVTLPEGTVMHPTYHELKQAMFVDEANRPEPTPEQHDAHVMAYAITPVDLAPAVRKPRKPRRKDINVSEATPF